MNDTAEGPPREGPDHGQLFQVASEQGGYFTTAQARSCGFSTALLTHHSKTGRYVRARHGLYRFRAYPSSPREDVIAAWLANGKEAAAVSHESALDLLGLSDVVPEAVHLTIPRSMRYRASSPGIVIHTSTRPPSKSEVVVREGIRVTAPVRSILDAAETGSAPEQVIAAIAQALERGIVARSKLRAAAKLRGGRVEQLVRRALEERPRP